MSNSGLVSYVKISPHRRSRNGHKIDTITIHCMAGQLSAETCAGVFQGTRVCSSNYGIGPDGKIGLYVEESERSICTSSTANDQRAITIEVASDTHSPYKVKDAAYSALIDLLVDICQRNGIPRLLWRGDKSLAGQVELQNMSVHRWYSPDGKSCPGDYLYERHSEIANLVNARLGTGGYGSIQSNVVTNVTHYPVSTTPSYNSYSYLTPMLPTLPTDSAIFSKLGIGKVVDISESNPSGNAASTGNSSLVNYVNRLNASTYSARTEKISCITIHIARKIGSLNDLGVMLNSSKKSYHYGIDSSGNIGLFADEATCTTSSDNERNDARAVNIICMNSKLKPDYEISKQCYDSLIKLCTDICQRNYILNLRYGKDKYHDTLTLHSQFRPSSKCPGNYIESKISDIIKQVNYNIVNNITVEYTKVYNTPAHNETAALRAQSMVSIKTIKPYVIQPSPKLLNVDYNSLRRFGVVGVMLDAGERYNDKHEIVAYRTETVYKQTLEVKESNLPYSYIYTTHARNIQEVKEEAYWFYFVVSKYPPKLGVWLRCRFDVKKSKIDRILEEWYAFFVDWGLKSKCGLRCTKDQAAKIGWPKQCSYMPLWLEGDLSESTCPDEELLTPSFFKLDNLSKYEEEKNLIVAAADSSRYTG